MNKLVVILSLALCFALSGEAYAQRYLPGQKGIQLTAGTVNGFNLKPQSSDFAFHAGVALSSYAKNGNRWLFGSEFLEKRYSYKDWSIPQTQFTAEGGYYWNFLSDGSKTVFFSLGTAFMTGYEILNWNKTLLPDGATLQNKNAFIYGGALTLEMETFLTDWAVLLFNVRERMLLGSSVGKFNTQVGLGMKFILN